MPTAEESEDPVTAVHSGPRYCVAMPHFALNERRTTPRFESEGLQVAVRRKGRLGQLHGPAFDFNKHGLAVILDQPLAKETTVFLCLTGRDARLDNIVGVIHNCIPLQVGYRCGIQFRTQSELQLDQEATIEQLGELEAEFSRSR